MKISQLVGVLEDLKEEYGDQYIWGCDLDFPLPRSFEIELSKKLKITKLGFQGGKAGECKIVEVLLEYEGGVNLVDRSFDEKRDW